VDEDGDAARRMHTHVLDAGVDGFVFNMVANGHVPGVVAMACEALRPLVKG
jgi:hypothetical protein